MTRMLPFKQRHQPLDGRSLASSDMPQEAWAAISAMPAACFRQLNMGQA